MTVTLGVTACQLPKYTRRDQKNGGFSLGRIETGKQPYSQPILEAIAKALNVSPAALISVDPEKDGDIVSLVHKLSPEKRRQAKAILEAFSKAS